MNEFIVWDDEDNKFICWEDTVFSKDKNDDFVIIMKEIDPILSEGRNFQTFNANNFKLFNYLRQNITEAIIMQIYKKFYIKAISITLF